MNRENDENRCEREGFRWYFIETNRRDAERFLEQPHNGKGTFLIRPSDTNQGTKRYPRMNLEFFRLVFKDKNLYHSWI